MRKDFSGVARMHTPISKVDLSGSPSGEVKTYRLSPEELKQYCSSLPPRPRKTDMYATTGRQLKAKGVR